MMTVTDRRFFPRCLQLPGLVMIVTLCLATSCLAEPTSDGASAVDPSRVRASSQASVVAAPDLVVVQLAVISEAAEAAAAAGANAEATHKVLESLRQAFADSAEVETSGYSLSPRYEYQESRTRHLVGFSARSALRVKSRDVAAAGRVIDVAVAAGADEINGIHFSLSDDTPQREQALADATRQARRRADVMAQALGLRVVRVLAVDGSAPTAAPRPMQGRVAAMEAGSRPTPIEPGGIEVRAYVSIEVEVGP